MVILVDGLRADLPGTSGAEAAFFEAAGLPAGVRFSSAYAQAPTPFLSLGAVLSGRYPTSLPLCGPLSSGNGAIHQPWCMQIPEDVPTLPEVLGLENENTDQAGSSRYQSLLIADGIPGDPVLGQEFDAWQSYGNPTASQPPAYGDVQEQASSWWTETSGPRLLVIASGALSLEQKPEVRTQIGIQGSVENLDSQPSADLRSRAHEVYTELARDAGSHIGAVIASLETSERPIVQVVGGLSGTSLIETSPFPDQPVPALSSGLLLERTLRVPLHVSGTAIEAGEVEEVVELVDILPTLLTRTGDTLPAGAVGSDLLGSRPESDPLAYAQFGDMRALRMGPYLLTWRAFVHGASTLDPRVGEGLAYAMQTRHRLFLHRVTEDGLQEVDLKESETDALRALLVELFRREMIFAAPPEELMTPDHIRELQMSSSDGYW